MYPESLLTRFRAVDALAQQGAPGERDNAQRIVERMERDHPNIRAFAYPPTPPPETTEWYESGRARTADPWERFRSAASGAWSWASRVAQEVAAASYARDLADNMCELHIKYLPSGKWQLALRMESEEMQAAAVELTPFQKNEFIQHILANIETELHDALR
jgi:hypothetical protein